jgi:hypothetical protein
MRAVGVKSYSAAVWKFRLTSSRFLPRLAVSHGGDGGSRHATSHAVADTAHRADQINVQVSRACRQVSVQSASLLSPRQPEPCLTCGLDTAEPHIRSPLIAAGTKIPHTRGHRARKERNQSLSRHLAARTLYGPLADKGQLPSRMAGFSFDVARWIRPLSTQPPPAPLPVGGTTISQTRGSPRFQASNVLSSVSPSIMSVFARHRRLDTATEAGSTTWLSMSFASSDRCTQKPSRPASWMTTTLSDPPTSCSALPRRRASKASNLGASPAAIEYFDDRNHEQPR